MYFLQKFGGAYTFLTQCIFRVGTPINMKDEIFFVVNIVPSKKVPHNKTREHAITAKVLTQRPSARNF